VKPGDNKMKNILSVLFMTAAVAVSGVASAGTHVEEVWDCSLREGKTMEQVNATNAKWVKFINKQVKGGGISSRTVTPLVGDLSSFVFVDAFPNLQSWTDAKAAMESKQGQKLEAEFDATSECSSNRLYNSTN
jgi:hypothetical protein